MCTALLCSTMSSRTREVTPCALGGLKGLTIYFVLSLATRRPGWRYGTEVALSCGNRDELVVVPDREILVEGVLENNATLIH